MTMLFVDDDPAVCRAMRRLATACGWESLACDQFADIGGLVRDHEIDLLVCDYTMAPTNGLQIIERLRSEGWNRLAVIMTANPEWVDRSLALQLNVAEILPKPVEVDVLQSVVARAAAEIERRPRFVSTLVDLLFQA